jgi:hypothetical protein
MDPKVVEVAMRAWGNAPNPAAGPGGVRAHRKKPTPSRMKAAIRAADEARGLREEYGTASNGSNEAFITSAVLEAPPFPSMHSVRRLVSEWRAS